MNDARQITIWELPYPTSPGVVRGSATSKAAAEAIAPVRQTVCQKVLRCISDNPRGCTSSDVSVSLNIRINTVTARLRELQLSGAIIDTGETRVCPSSGHAKTVYRITGVPHNPQRVKQRSRAAQARVDALLDLRGELIKLNAAKHGFTTLRDFVELIDEKLCAVDNNAKKDKTK